VKPDAAWRSTRRPVAPRARSFLLGSAIVAVALVLVPALIYWATDGALGLAIRGAVLVVVVALGAFFVILQRKPSRRVAGQSCVLCARKVIYEHEGDFCDVCAAPAHGTCLGEHRASAHGEAKAPFR
jgi:uncharacterized RDD family membrane protein YckC